VGVFSHPLLLNRFVQRVGGVDLDGFRRRINPWASG